MIRYYGWYSNKSRGLRAKSREKAARPTEGNGPSAKDARKRWAALIKQIYEVDPLVCPKCGAQMKIISFIERHQRQLIEKILRHCGLWEEAPARETQIPISHLLDGPSADYPEVMEFLKK